jgi:CRISPR-associated protein Csy3
LEYPLHDFDQIDEKVQTLANQIAQALKGETLFIN